MKDSVCEGARQVPVAVEVDLCVLGGSCTGVFAAVRAARLGLKVAVVEGNGFFGGVATAGLVCIWHSTFDTEFRRPVIGGLTVEVLERLRKRAAVRELQPPNAHAHFYLNTEELKIELDELAREAGVRPFLHARFCAPVLEDGVVTAAVIEDKSGRRAIRARAFVDATGDGDLVARAGLPWHTGPAPQPSTACAVFQGLEALAEQNPGFSLKTVFDPRHPESLRKGFLWSARCVGGRDLTMVAGTRAHGLDCADADQLTQAEMECRRQVRAMGDIFRKYYKGGDAVALVNLAAYIGIRETRHTDCLHTLTEREVLEGTRFPDAIANGSYRVDVHHHDRPGLTFRYLDGSEEVLEEDGQVRRGRWRPPTPANPTFYQVPYRSLVPRGARNVLVAGRLMDAYPGAYGAVRVMVNCNQTGEAAGVAAALALREGVEVGKVDAVELRETLARGGSIIL
jgi:hypothetical protein